MSRAWRLLFRLEYRLLRIIDPLVRLWWGAFGLGNVVELDVAGRRTRRPRPVLVGLLTSGATWYLGHPDGQAQWTRNLAAAGRATVRRPGLATVTVRAVRLSPGPERDAAIRATSQHPFPGNVVYRLARRYVLAAGDYFRLEPEGDHAPSAAAGA